MRCFLMVYIMWSVSGCSLTPNTFKIQEATFVPLNPNEENKSIYMKFVNLNEPIDIGTMSSSITYKVVPFNLFDEGCPQCFNNGHVMDLFPRIAGTIIIKTILINVDGADLLCFETNERTVEYDMIEAF